jgi:hypothetical protein
MSMLDNFPLRAAYYMTNQIGGYDLIDDDVPCNMLPEILYSEAPGGSVQPSPWNCVLFVPPTLDVRDKQTANQTWAFAAGMQNIFFVHGYSAAFQVVHVADYFLFQENWYRACFCWRFAGNAALVIPDRAHRWDVPQVQGFLASTVALHTWPGEIATVPLVRGRAR